MSNTVELAKDLMALAAGPAILGVSALFVYARSALDAPQRIPAKGWLTVGAGLVIVAWNLLFLLLSAPTVLQSWAARGSVSPVLVLLSATWIVSMGLVIVALLNGRRAVRYLLDSYPPASRPGFLRLLARMLRLSSSA